MQICWAIPAVFDAWHLEIKAGCLNPTVRIGTNLLITLVFYVFLVKFAPVVEDVDRPIILQSLS